MYYLYVPCACILALYVLMDTRRKGRSKWWALAVFFSPPVSLWYFVATRAEKAVVPVLIVVVSLAAVGAGEAIIYSVEKKKAEMAKYSPVGRQMIKLTKKLKNATVTLDNAIEELEKMSKIQSRRSGVAETIEFIGQLKVLNLRHKTAVNRLNTFIADYRKVLARENLLWLEQIKEYYNSKAVIRYEETLDHYLEAFLALLQYVFENYYEIEERSPRYIKNYDAYYMRYRRAVDRHNRVGVKRIEFQNRFLEKNPRLRPYLPSSRQTDFLILWE
ncbi:MAG: hypothetical protein R6V54_14840 [Desulfobacteraceae bacterium]